jgi:hypothetical protein
MPLSQQKGRTMATLAPIFAAIVAFASAFFFDMTIRALRVRGPDTALVGLTLWVSVAIEVAFVAAVLVSSWLIAMRFRPTRWLSIALAVLELIVILMLPLAAAGLPYLSSLIHASVVFGASDTGPGTSLSIQACAIFLAALYSFFAQPRPHAA